MMKNSLPALVAMVGLLLAGEARGLGKQENPLHIGSCYESAKKVALCEESLAAGDRNGFFKTLAEVLSLREKGGDFCLPREGGLWQEVDEVLLGLLSRLGPGEARRGIRERGLPVKRLLGAPDFWDSFLYRGLSLAVAARQQADRCFERGRFLEALWWYRLLRGNPRPGEGVRLRQTLCWAGLGAWDRVRAEAVKVCPEPWRQAWKSLERAADEERFPPLAGAAAARFPWLPGRPVREMRLPDPGLDASLPAPRPAARNSAPCRSAFSQGRLFAATPFTVSAFSYASGELLWRHPEFIAETFGADLVAEHVAIRVWRGKVFVAARGQFKAFDAATGKLLWFLGRRTGVVGFGASPAEPDEFDDTCAFSAPVFQGDRAFLAWVRNRGAREASLLEIDGNGRIHSRTFLCSAKALVDFNRPPRPGLVRAGAHLFVQTDMGALFAYHMRRRRILWARTYERGSVASRNLLKTPRREVPSLLGGSMVFFAPTDTPFLFACNTLTGETIFKAPRPEAGMACVAGGLLLAGDDLRVLDTNQGLLRQRLILPRPAVGPPLPLAKGVFLPLEGQALILTGTPLTMAARVLVPQRRWDAVGLGGTVLSRSGQGMRVWENRLKVHDRASSMAQSPDPRDRLKAAGLWAEIGDAEKALVLLRELTTAGKEIAASAQELRVALLAQKLRRAAGVLNEAEADEAATELSEFSKDPAVGLGAARKALRDRDWERAVPLLLHVLQSSPDAIVSFPGPRPAREAVRELAFSFGLGGPDPAAYRCAVAAAVHLPSGGEGPLAVENLLHAYILLPSTEWDSAKTLAASFRRGGSEVRARNLLKEFALHSSVPSLAAAGLLSRLGASSGHRGSARLWAGRVAEIVLGNFSGAGGWAPFQADPTLLHTGQAPYRLVWRLEDMPEEGLLRPVIPRGGGALAGRWVFIGTPNTLWCLDSHTGVARWIRRTGTRRGPVLCHGSRLVVVSAEGLENLDAGTGNTVWRFPFPRPLGQGEADLVLWGGRLAAAVPVAEGTALYGLDARTGRPEWTVLLTCGRPYLWVPLEDAKVLLYAGDGRRYHVDLCDGTCREDASLGKALSVKKGKAEVFHTGLFRVAGAFRSGHEAVLWGADAGRILWRKSVPRLEAVIAGSGLLFAALRAKWGDVDIVCLDAMSGLPRWTRRLAWEQVAGMQLHPSGKLLVHGREKAGRLAVLSGTSGDVLWTAPLKSDGFSVSGEAVAFSDGWSKVSFRDLSTGRSLGSTEVGPGRLKGVHFLAGPILLAVTTGGVGILGPVQAVPVPFDAVRDPDAAVHLFGAGRPREALRTWTRALACDDRVVFGPWDAALLNARGLWEEASWRKKRVLGVYRMERPPTIDGLLNEAWAPGGSVLIEAPVHLNFVRGFWQDDASLWRGPYDLGVRLFTGWDEDYFYTALLIHDQIRVPVDGTLDRLNGDLVYMAFDMAGDGGTTMGRDDFVQIFVSWKKGTRPGGDKPDRRFRRKDLRLGVTPDGTGVIWESALPWSFINDELTRAGMRAHHVKPRPGVSFGFNVVVVDDDGKGAKTTMSLAPGLRFGRDDRPARLETGGPFRVLDRRFCPGAFVRVELR